MSFRTNNKLRMQAIIQTALFAKLYCAFRSLDVKKKYWCASACNISVYMYYVIHICIIFYI